MKKTYEINKNIFVEINKKRNRTIISLVKDGEKTLLSDLKTNDYFWSNIVFDENYIIVYSRGCIVNQIPLTIECAYNINTDEILDTKEDKKLAVELEYMYISKYSFEVGAVLSVINDQELNITDEDEIEHITRYLTNGNENISREEIKDYILRCYPNLQKYTNLNSTMTVLEYRNIVEEIGQRYLAFHKIPQQINQKENQMVPTLKK